MLDTTTLLLVTLPNIHQFYFFHSPTQQYPFLIWLLTTPPHLKYVATLPCNLSLMACFADINVSQGSAATHARCSAIFNNHTHTHPFNGPLSGTIQVSRYQKGKTNLDFTEARDSGWQWHQLGYIQVCTSLQTDNHTSTPPLLCFYRPDALPAAQPTASKH